MRSSGYEFRIDTAVEEDIPSILGLIKGLAEYEHLSGEASVTAENLRATLFGEHKVADVLLARVESQVVGFAVFFQNYSTFLGRPGIYLEDLFVLPAWRKRGCGRQLLQHVARIAVERNCGRLEWSALDWNKPAIRFYKSLGAREMHEWTVYRLTGEALQRLGGS